MIPKIKPLEWRIENDGNCYVETVIGVFIVAHGIWSCRGRIKYMTCRDNETAKAAAEAYYQSLIRSTLE